MLRLRTAYGVDLREYRDMFGRDFDAGFLAQCIGAGYAVRDGEWVSLTPQGYLVSNQIIGRALELSG